MCHINIDVILTLIENEDYTRFKQLTTVEKGSHL